MNENDELEDLIAKVDSRSTFLTFLAALRRDLAVNHDQWENSTLPCFLEAMEAWVASLDGYYKNMGRGAVPPQPTWKMLAEILTAASVYE